MGDGDVARGIIQPKPDHLTEEQRNIRNLLRAVGLFVAWPALSISIAFSLDLEEHLLHIVGLFPLGLAGLGLFFLAPRLAVKWA